jgi:Holliday junction DNA helicase RuvB
MAKKGKQELEAYELLKSQETDEDLVVNLSLRPKKLSEFVGQKKIVENLKISIEAAKKRNEPMEHIFFSGPPGLGKTTLAHIIAHEVNSKITCTSGPAVDRAGDLIGVLTNLEEKDILFIDEIHRLSKNVEEFMYPAMENFQIDFMIDKGPYAKTINFNIKPFTFIGATTRAGLLTAPLRTRFGMFFHLEFYEPEDLVKIIKRSASILGVPLDAEGAAEIARRSRGTPRVANRLLRRVRDFAEVKGDGSINKDTADKALSMHGVDDKGLNALDRKILETIIKTYKGGPVGIDSLAATLNEEKDIVTDVVEPYLLKIGFLKRSPRGRQATEAALKHFDLELKSDHQKELF